LFLDLQVAGPLITRVSNADLTFNKEMELEARITPDFEWTLDNGHVMHTINTLNFFQMKGTYPTNEGLTPTF
jgi:hypothetical protein